MADKKIIGIYVGGFKPPTKGHFEVVKRALSQNPEIDEFLIYVGSAPRDGITQEESLKIWDIYKKYLPFKVQIVKSLSTPVKELFNFSEENPDKIILWVLGAGEGNEEDFKDIANRTKSVPKYDNITVQTIITTGGVSGTAARNALSVSKEKFTDFLPDVLSEEEKQEIYVLLTNKITEQLNENTSYSSNIDYKKYIKELLGYYVEKYPYLRSLPKIKLIHGDVNNAKNFFGKTAYYDPNIKTIVLYTEGRHPKDIVRSLSHEFIHFLQDERGDLNNITTQNTTEDDYLNQIEKEAYLDGNINFRNWTDSLNEIKKDYFGLNNYIKELAQEFDKEYKQYFLNELFEKDLPIIDKVHKNLYIVSNGDDIEAKYDIRLEIPERDLWSINWFFTQDNKNTSPEAWKQVTATSFRILEDWLKTNNPKAIYISGNTGAKTKLYKAYVDKLQTLLNNRYKIDNSDEDRVILRSIEETYQYGIKKRIETLNESYKQALHYFQNGDINSKSKIERWYSIKNLIEREILKEIYIKNKPIKYKKDIFGLSAYAMELGRLKKE